jgi:hypothetical protein
VLLLLLFLVFHLVLVDDTTYLAESARYGGGEARTRTPVLLLQDIRTNVSKSLKAPTAFEGCSRTSSRH